MIIPVDLDVSNEVFLRGDGSVDVVDRRQPSVSCQQVFCKIEFHIVYAQYPLSHSNLLISSCECP